MSLHSRPVPSPRTPGSVTLRSPSPPAPDAASPPPSPPRPAGDPPPAAASPDRARTVPPEDIPPHHDPAPAARADAAGADPAWPWYRSEPWLAALLAGLAVGGLTAVAPQPLRLPLLALVACCLVASVALLARQGLFRPMPRPEPRPRDPRRR